MICIHLDDATRSELNLLRRSDLPVLAGNRIEMLFLSDAGWSPPRIAGYLGYHPQAVRDRLRDFVGRGTDALFPRKPDPAPEGRRQGGDGRRERDPDREVLLPMLAYAVRCPRASLQDLFDGATGHDRPPGRRRRGP